MVCAFILIVSTGLENRILFRNLSDTHNRGALDVSDFIVAMYLIQASMSGQIPFIPTTLPPGLYEMASDQPSPGSAVRSHTTGASGSISPGLPGIFPQNSGSGLVQAQLTGKQLQPQYSGQPLQQQLTGQATQYQTGSKPGPSRTVPASSPFSAIAAVQSQLAWDVTPAEKASADKLFDRLDTQKRGYIESDVAVPFMLQSKLPEEDLASIWLASSNYALPL
jgi:epidermal growth factor receptor substrate 15